MYFAKLTAFSLFGAALSAPVRNWKRDVASDITAAFTKANGDVAAPLKSLADHFAAADHSDATATITAITPDIQAVADAINAASNTIVDLDDQHDAAVQPIVDAANTLYATVFDGFKDVTDLYESDKGFAGIAYGALSQVGAEVASTMNMASLRTSSDVIKGLAATISQKYGNVINDFGASIGTTINVYTKKRSVRRDTASDAVAAVQDVQSKLADQLKSLNDHFAAANHDDESATWDAIQADEQAIEGTLNDGAVAITKLAKQTGADTTAIVDATTATMTDFFNGMADLTKLIDDNSAFSLIVYGPMSSLGTKVNAFLFGVASRFEDGNVLTTLQQNLAQFVDEAKLIPGVDATLTM